MGRTAEWRPELVELANDSVSSTCATIPSSPRGARSMTGASKRSCTSRSREMMGVGNGVQDLP